MTDKTNQNNTQDSKRSNVRSKLFGKKEFAYRDIDLFGETVRVVQPSVGQILKAQQNQDTKNALVNLLIDYCYIPGTKEKVFEKGDEAAIMEWPVGPWFSELNSAIADLTNIDVSGASKNSD